MVSEKDKEFVQSERKGKTASTKHTLHSHGIARCNGFSENSVRKKKRVVLKEQQRNKKNRMCSAHGRKPKTKRDRTKWKSRQRTEFPTRGPLKVGRNGREKTRNYYCLITRGKKWIMMSEDGIFTMKNEVVCSCVMYICIYKDFSACVRCELE